MPKQEQEQIIQKPSDVLAEIINQQGRCMFLDCTGNNTSKQTLNKGVPCPLYQLAEKKCILDFGYVDKRLAIAQKKFEETQANEKLDFLNKLPSS